MTTTGSRRRHGNRQQPDVHRSNVYCVTSRDPLRLLQAANLAFRFRHPQRQTTRVEREGWATTRAVCRPGNSPTWRV